jgi:hypothetical protein
MMTKKPLPLLSLCVAMASVSAQAADEIFCEDYARDLIIIPTDSNSSQKLCQKNQSHWNDDKASHMKWCLGVDEAEANKKRYNHNNLVNLCNDSYKLIMIDRKRVASLPISANEEMQMDNAPAEIKIALTNGTIKSSYSQLFAEFNQAINNGKLKKCSLYSLSVDLDKDSSTKEWVISTDNTCLEEHQFEHVWVVQQVKDDYRILFEGEDDTLNIRFSETNQYKNISISTPLKVAEETNKRCGSINADWHYVAGRYIPFQGRAEEHGSCLPDYNLPDYLQGENTFELAEGEWEKGMEAEEKKRVALFSPYKQALEDYIPEWIRHVKSKIPADQSLMAVNASQTSSDSKETDDISSVESKSVAADQKKSKKGFMENIRAFLGLD